MDQCGPLTLDSLPLHVYLSSLLAGNSEPPFQKNMETNGPFLLTEILPASISDSVTTLEEMTDVVQRGGLPPMTIRVAERDVVVVSVLLCSVDCFSEFSTMQSTT
ncbi:hypothetical protein OIU85_006819 [Salix viminalis]|uniref:Uncharacterized protein n=1 Tax=Salix viminalis TaxID=40686 RepID=A0A9Q0SVH2_SALVM|nr:hypothetical protein OIU85_006819 [Salix viminalis]